LALIAILLLVIKYVLSMHIYFILECGVNRLFKMMWDGGECCPNEEQRISVGDRTYNLRCGSWIIPKCNLAFKNLIWLRGRYTAKKQEWILGRPKIHYTREQINIPVHRAGNVAHW
jgi:hypothetical protein